ncbi:MAG: HtaA domain-containing protein [Arcanobacterium sp.]|nr:HtaA domain-containing protein [Arcanobacterium sp.]
MAKILRSTAAGVLALMLAFFGITALSPQARAAEPSPTITGGSLDWGIKDSFFRYLKMPLASGTTTLDGITSGGNGFIWPAATGGTFDGTTASFTGSVRAVAHEGILDSKFTDPIITVSGSTGTISVISYGREFIDTKTYGEYVGPNRITIANLTGATVTTTDTSATMTFTGAALTDAGREAFGKSFYNTGETLNIPSVTLTLEPAPQPESSDSTGADGGEATSSEPNTGAAGSTGTTTDPAVTDDPTSSDEPDTTSEPGSAAEPGTTDSSDTGTTEGTPSAPTQFAFGFKDSFWRYFTSPFAFGVLTPSDGASVSDATHDGSDKNGNIVTNNIKVLHYTLENSQAYDAQNPESIAFKGSVNFNAHHGAMNITLADPTITFGEDPNTATLSFLVTTGGADGNAQPTRVNFASLANITVTGTEATAVIESTDVTALEGISVFGKAYKVGDELNPVTLVVPKTLPAPAPQPENPQAEPASSSDNGSDDSSKPAKTQPQPQPEKKQPAKCTVDPTNLRATSGSLSWGVRDSFTSYIRGSIAKGGFTTAGGASWNGSDFVFPLTGGVYDSDAYTGTLYYGGSVAFTGHEGILKTTFSNPVLTIRGSNATLSATVNAQDMKGNVVYSGQQIALVTMRLSSASLNGGHFNFSASATTLTSAGTKAFAEFYASGEPMDGLTGNAAMALRERCNPDGTKTIFDAFGAARTGDPNDPQLASTGSSLAGFGLAALILTVAGLALAGRSQRARTAA